jgi:hypothetical protein
MFLVIFEVYIMILVIVKVTIVQFIERSYSSIPSLSLSQIMLIIYIILLL